MNLDTPDKTIEIVLGEAMTTANCDITAAYAIVATDAFLLAASDLVSNGTTPVTVVPAPTLPPGAGAQQNQVKEIRLHNNDTVTHQVILRLNNGGTIRIMESESVASGGDFLYTPDAPASVSAAAPAVLLESGAVGEKISAMSAVAIPPGAAGTMVPVVVPGNTTNFQSPLATLLTGADGTALAQGEGFTIATGDDGASGAQGAGTLTIQTGADVSGGGPGNIQIGLGNSITTGVAGAQLQILTGAASVGDADGGDLAIVFGSGAGTGRRGLMILNGLVTSDPSVSEAFWASNGRVLLSGAIIDPVTSTVASGSAVALVTGTAKDVTTISVPTGNWTITGAVYFTGNAATTVTLIQGSVGTVANTIDTTPGQFDTEYLAGATLTVLGADPALLGFSADVTLGGTTTYRLDAKATFALNTLSAYGTIRAVPRA